MPDLLAEFTSTPKGTQYRQPLYDWQTAGIGDPLYDQYQSRNAENDDYSIEVYSGVLVDFPDGSTTITAGEYTGTAEYESSPGQWDTLPENQGVTAYGVRTGKNTTVPITIAGFRGTFQPRTGP